VGSLFPRSKLGVVLALSLDCRRHKLRGCEDAYKSVTMEEKRRLLLTCGRNRRDSMEERVALLVAPVGMRESAEYFAAFKLAEDGHPDQRIVPDTQLWSTVKEFAQAYKKWLGSVAVSNFYILTAPDGTVGRGIFDVWRYLRKNQKSKTTALFPTGSSDGSFE
jgi:hypothetical protein